MSYNSALDLVLHLEHDADVLLSIIIKVAEDEVPLGAPRDIVVLLEVCLWHDGAKHLVVLDAAMLLQSLSDHLGAHPNLQVLIISDLVLNHLQLGLILLLLGCKAIGCFTIGNHNVSSEFCYFSLLLKNLILRLLFSLHHSNLLCIFSLLTNGVQLSLKTGNLRG